MRGALVAVGLGVLLAVACTPVALPACPTEDSSNCYWDAATQGNGRGTSFVSVQLPTLSK